MNKDQLKKNVGHWVRLVPIAHRLDALGHPLPSVDYEWFVQSVTDDGVTISLPATGHCRLLPFDNISEYTSDRVAGGRHLGFLTLKVQLSIQGNEIHATPTRPGVPVPVRIAANPIRLTILQRLRDRPAEFVTAGVLAGVTHEDAVNEIARCAAERLVDAKMLRGDRGLADAVALRLTPRGAEWLRTLD